MSSSLTSNAHTHMLSNNMYSYRKIETQNITRVQIGKQEKRGELPSSHMCANRATIIWLSLSLHAS